MATPDQQISASVSNIPECLAGGYIDYVACFVCRKTTNLGMALTKARAAIPEIEATV